VGTKRSASKGRVTRLAAGAPAPEAPLPGELGVDGIGNYSGDIQAENNNRLLHEAAYGTPGSRSWGEYEKLLRTNPFVAMGMDFIGGHIRDARIGVKASEKVADGQRHADFVKWALTEKMEPGVAAVNQQMTEGLTPGFSLHELVWDDVQHETLPGGRGLGIVRMAERLPSTVAHQGWHLAGGELSFVRQQGPDDTGAWGTYDIPAAKLALFSWKRRGNNFAGYSVWRPVWYLAKIQEQLLKLAGISLVREGAGIPTAVSSSDRAAKLTDGQRKKLQRLLENLVFHENAAVVMPFGWSIEWVYSPGANKGHVLDAWQQLGSCILTIVQAQQLSLGINGTGSRAVGDTHDGQSFAFVQGVVSELEAVWNGVGSRAYTGAVKKLVDANFGPQSEYPKLTITLKRPQLSPGARLDAATKAVATGLLTVTLDDENVVREDLGFAPIDHEAREEALEAKAARAPVMAPPFGGAGEQAEEDEDEGEEVDDAPKKMSARPFVPSRPLRPSEMKLDLVAMAQALDAAPVEFEQRVRPIIAEMLVAAGPAITAAMQDGNPDEVATMQFDTARLEKAVTEYHAQLRQLGARQVAKELRATVPQRLVKMQEEEELDEAVVKAEQVVQQSEKGLVRRMVARLRGELEREAVDVVRTGGSAGEVVARTVVKQIETGAFKADAGSVTTRIWNVGRDEAARLIGGVDEVERSAVLDTNTCPTCEAADGQTAEFDSPAHDRLTPPDRNCDGRDKCRCLLLFRKKEAGDE
jgi:hypothetical protein